MNKPTIVIDAGHGGSKDIGLSGNKGRDGLMEKGINLEIASRLAYFCGNHNLGYVMTRWGDREVPLRERCKIANATKAELLISLHCNYASDEKISGVETLYNDNSKAGKAFAFKFQRNLMSLNYGKDRGIKSRDDLYILRYTRMPSVLIEFGFLSNAGNASYLDNPEKQTILAENVFRTIDKVYNPHKYSQTSMWLNWNPFKNLFEKGKK